MPMRLSLILGLLFPWIARSEEHFILELGEAKTYQAKLDFRVSYPNLKAKEWIVFAPLAPELPGQAKAQSELLLPKVKTIQEKGPQNRSLLISRFPIRKSEEEKELFIQTKYRIQLQSRILKSVSKEEKALVEKVADLTAAERKKYIQAYSLMDYYSAYFQDWLKKEDLIRKKEESELDFGRRVYLAIRQRGKYRYQPDDSRRASEVCQHCETDCGGFSILFTTIMRANKIPARSRYGRWAKSAKPDEKLNGEPYYQAHVKAEFFATGIGWIPIDLANSIVHDKSKEGLRDFGNDPGDFITLHIDPDIRVDTQLFGIESLKQMQCPAWWVSGGGNTKEEKIQEQWTVEPVK